MRTLLVLTLAAVACRDAPKAQHGVAADSVHTMEHHAAEGPDTAAERKREELGRCAFEYDADDQLRDCLAKIGWAPQDADREIARYRARQREMADSLRRIGR